MPKDQNTGAAGNAFGRETAKQIARAIGALLLGKSSNEATYQGNQVVIKCARAATSSVGVTYNMIERIHSVIGAFQQADGSFSVISISAEIFKNEMRETKSQGSSAGKVGLVSRSVFVSKGKEIKTVTVAKP